MNPVDRSIALYVTEHGYGHLARCLEVARELRRLAPETKLHVRAPFPREQVEAALGFPPDSHAPVRLDVGLVQLDSLRADLPATVERLGEYYGAEGDRLVGEEARWLERSGIDAALIDIPPRAFDACRLAGVPAYGLTNFSWDWIWRDLAEEEPRLAPFAEKAAESYASCARLFRTVMHAGLDAFPTVEDVPLVARISRTDPEEVRSMLRLVDGRTVVVLSFGGAGVRGITPPPAALHERFLFIASEPLPDPGPPFVYINNETLQGKGLRYCDLVAAADIAMSKPGYSTVAECLANRTAMIYSDRSRFAEYPVIVRYIREKLPSERIDSGDLLAGRWGGALDRLVDRRPFRFPPERIDGAEVVARRLLEEVGGADPG